MRCFIQRGLHHRLMFFTARPLGSSAVVCAGRKWTPKRKSAQRNTIRVASAAGEDVREILKGLDFSQASKEEAPYVAPDFEQYDEGEDDKPKKRLPAQVRYFDTARIYLKSGDGGNGCTAFRREKFVPRGGPSGGDGGQGGHIWAVVDPSLNSLFGFRGKIHWRAKNGKNGEGSNCKGALGEDCIIPVPPGTVIRVKDADTEDPPLAELTKEGEKALLVAGGRGGKGNASFKTQSNTAPQICEKGEKGKELWVDLELKLVADVGIIGVPNAGKSTLLAGISAACPKIANYPFTTLVPNLGVCDLDYETTVFADVPGLLEGAAGGIGLGHEFLRHCMRCKVLVHMIDGTSQDPLGDYDAIQVELDLFSPDLFSKPQVVCFNKTDLPDVDELWPDYKEIFMEKGIPEENLFAVSAYAKKGLKPVIRRVRQFLKDLPEDEWEYEGALNLQEVPREKTDRADNYVIEEDRGWTPSKWFITGETIERFTQMTNWEYYEALKRFQRVLDGSGISQSLRDRGIKEGDDVIIGEMEFKWKEDQSERALYDTWLDSRKAGGRPRKGRKTWPHVGG